MLRLLVFSVCVFPLFLTIVEVCIASRLFHPLWLLVLFSFVFLACTSIVNRFLMRMVMHWYMLRSAATRDSQ